MKSKSTLIVIFLSLVLLAGFATHWVNVDNLKTVTINRAADGTMPPTNFSGIAMYANLSNIDQSSFSFKIHFDSKPAGFYRDESDPLERMLAKEVSISIDSDVQTYYQEGMIVSRDLSLDILLM
jgi:hypothetical protein